MPRIVVDFEPPSKDAPGFRSDTSDLVYFLSWAFSARYGGNHEMSLASLVLRGEFGIDLRPLLTFADRDVEVPEDQEALDRAWQDAAPLSETCRRVLDALASEEPRLQSIRADYPGLSENISELASMARWAADHAARIRVTFLLED